MLPGSQIWEFLSLKLQLIFRPFVLVFPDTGMAFFTIFFEQLIEKIISIIAAFLVVKQQAVELVSSNSLPAYFPD